MEKPPENPRALKHAFGRDMAHELGRRLETVRPRFDTRRFVSLATRDLETLELKQRIAAFSSAMRKTLPESYPEALHVIVQALPPELGPAADGFAGTFAVWPSAHFVETHGLQHPRESLEALHAITRRGTAEFAIRPSLVQHPALTLEYLRRWVRDPNEHVRRLVSEGTRSRLPWGMRVRTFVEDPGPLLDLLERLRDDPSEYVRRSVGNNLNDLLRDCEPVVLERLRVWGQVEGEVVRGVLRRALRSLVKAGHPEALELLGHGGTRISLVELALDPPRLALGGSLELRCRLRNGSGNEASLVVDYAIHFLRAEGRTSRKVFKLKEARLAPGEEIELVKRIPFRPVTVRKHLSGKHVVELQVNGRVLGSRSFVLEA